MAQPFADELRTDTSILIMPIIGAFTALLAIFTAIFAENKGQTWHLWVIVLLAPTVATLSWWAVRQQRRFLGNNLFIVSNLFLLILLMARDWQPGSVIPYYYIVLVVVTSMINRPSAGLIMWLASALSMVLVLAVRQAITFANLVSLLPPIMIAFLVAVAALLSALEWETAVESIATLHRRAQDRRDELFTAKEEITATNNRLSYLNSQLEIARQQALQERDLRTRFMNNVSHELRTPLNAIVNFAHILQAGGQGPVSEGQAEYLRRMEQSGWHLLSVLNDLLDMAQIQSGEFRLHLEANSLQPICEEAIKNLRALLIDKDEVEIVRDYPEKWPASLVDSMRLKQALINLLGNAAKYTEKGHIALRVRPSETAVQIVVEDTGIGIPAEYHEAIFQEFRQVDESAARKRIGTGLGLPITRHLIERHNGSLTVVSQPGQGSQFIITLPIHTPPLINLSELTQRAKER